MTEDELDNKLKLCLKLIILGLLVIMGIVACYNLVLAIILIGVLLIIVGTAGFIIYMEIYNDEH